MIFFRTIKQQSFYALNILAFLILTSAYSMAQGECWYLEMPKKQAEYLVQQCSKADQTKYDKALASLPNFIKKGKIKEIEICERAKGNNQQLISGKKHPLVEHKLPDNTILQSGAFYFSYQDVFAKNHSWGQFNLNPPMTAKTQSTYQIDTSRMVSKKWCPTFAKYEGNKCFMLLERDKQSRLEKPIIKSHLTILLSTPELDELKLVWLIPYTELPNNFKAFHLDMTSQRNKNIMFGDIGFEFRLTKSPNDIFLNVWHVASRGSKNITNKLKLKELPKGKVELPYMIIKNDGLLVKEGKHGSLKVTLTPVAK